jgi:1,4-dihydroxy-2-naphthoate octaprenyltransferase
MKMSTLLHLRIPFSFYLLPVFLFAFSISENVSITNFIIVAIALHVFLYPASNGYNSYFDKDEESIGGLKHPPEVSKELYWYALAFDLVALFLGLFIGWQFVTMLLLYGLISKAYSNPLIRLKKMPYIGWIIAGFFQGYFTFIMVYLGVNDISFFETFKIQIQLPAILSSLLLWGSYPMTQIYQHAEDKKRGDITISLKLGRLGTFHFTAVAFFIATQGFLYFYYESYSIYHAVCYFVFLTPVLGYFGYWYFKSRKNISEVNFTNTMKLNFISALSLNLFFLCFYFFR